VPTYLKLMQYNVNTWLRVAGVVNSE